MTDLTTQPSTPDKVPILYIEDGQAQFFLMQTLAEKNHYPYWFERAATQCEALELFNPKVHRLVLCDYHLPDAEAPEIAHKLLAIQANTLIVSFSEIYTQEKIHLAQQAGIIACLEKTDALGCLEQIQQLLASPTTSA